MTTDVDAAREAHWSQWLHDEVGLSWDDVNATVAMAEAEWDKREAAIRAEAAGCTDDEGSVYYERGWKAGRAAALDVERLARAICAANGDPEYVGGHITEAERLAAEYARLEAADAP